MSRIYLTCFLLLLAAEGLQAANPPGKGPSLIEAIHEMRLKQEAEENRVVRVIQPAPLHFSETCSPVQQARQRLKDAGDKKEASSGNVNIEAGHGELSIESNEGEINNSVNIQIVNPNEKNCL